MKKILSLLDGFLSLSAENDKIFREELMRDEEIKEMKQETLYLSTFERWAREDGLEEGRKEGRKDGRLEVARQMLLRGTDPTFICQVTGLSDEELTALSREMKSSS